MEKPSELEFFSINIAMLRRGRGWTQAELATRFGAKSSTISNWEKGVSYPQFSDLIHLSKILGVGLDKLVSKPGLEEQMASLDGVKRRLMKPQVYAEQLLSKVEEPAAPYETALEQRLRGIEARLTDLEDKMKS